MAKPKHDAEPAPGQEQGHADWQGEDLLGNEVSPATDGPVTEEPDDTAPEPKSKKSAASGT